MVDTDTREERTAADAAVLLACKYDRPVPRYTSYPTAPHFTPDVDREVYREWLAALPGDAVLSLYLHVPFCDTLCWFCGCHTRVVNRYDPIARYSRLLEREIDLVADALPGRLAVAHVHFGGGTPTILEADDFGRLMDRLRTRFRLREDAEVAVEIDPRDLPPERIRGLAAAGVTRASLGVQDFDPKVQKAINRVQSYEETRAVVDGLREAGIAGINIDLMYGLPHQTVEGVVETVDRTLTLGPDRVALFGYAHVPWMKRHQRLIDEAHLPGTETRFRQARAAARRLAERGFVAIGLDHFARADDPMAVALAAGRLNRNFQGYTTDDAEVLIGFGASAIGALPQGYAQNAVELGAWRRAIEDGRLATERGVAVSAEDRLRRAIIQRLMCDLAVDLEEIAAAHGRSAADFADEIAALAPFVADGAVVVDGSRIAVTEAGRPLVRTVCAVFDTYLASGAGRHSRAI